MTVTSVPWVLARRDAATRSEPERRRAHVSVRSRGPARRGLLAEPASRARAARLSRRRQLAGLALARRRAAAADAAARRRSATSCRWRGGAALSARGRRRSRSSAASSSRSLRAVAAALLINCFFVEPDAHARRRATPTRSSRSSCSCAVAAIVSGAVELAARRARAAERASARGGDAVGARRRRPRRAARRCATILEQARETFGMESVALKVRERGSGEWIDAEQRRLGTAGQRGAAALRRADRRRRCGWSAAGRRCSPRTSACCRRSRRAAQTALRGPPARASRRDEAREPRDRRPPAHRAARGGRPRPAHAAGRHQGGGQHACARPTSSGPTRSATSCWRRSRSRPTGSTPSSRNLLDASRLQAGALSVHAEPVALDEVVGAALLALPDAAGRVRGRRARRPAARAAPTPGLLERVLVNLLDNALRHGASDGPVEVTRARRRRERQARGRRPRARAYRAEQRERLFEPFQRLDDRGTGGVGLGLVGRARVHRGDGRRRSSPTATAGGGLTMRIRLPPLGRRCATDDPGAGRRGRARPAPGAGDQPARPRLRRSTSPPTATAALAARGAASARRRRARPRPARHGRRRGDRGPARLERRRRSSCCPPAPASTTRSSRSTPARTTTSPSRSAWTSCSPACAPRCAAAPAARTCPSSRPRTFTVDLAAKQARRGRRDDGPAHADRVAPARGARAQRGQAGLQRQLLQEVWGPRYETETNYLRVYMAQLRRKLEPDPARPRHLLTEPGIGLPLRAQLTPRVECLARRFRCAAGSRTADACALKCAHQPVAERSPMFRRAARFPVRPAHPGSRERPSALSRRKPGFESRGGTRRRPRKRGAFCVVVVGDGKGEGKTRSRLWTCHAPIAMVIGVPGAGGLRARLTCSWAII